MPPPYRRRRTTRRRPMRRRATRSSIYGAAGRQLYRDVKTLKNLINVEFKVRDNTFTGSTGSGSGNIECLNGLQQGDDFNRRSGRQVRFKSLQWNVVFTKHASATATRIRAIILIDKEPRQVSAAMTDVLDTSVFAPIQAFRMLDARKRFVILKDKTFNLNTDYPEKFFKGYMKMDMKTIYDASNNGDISDIHSNSLHMLLVSDEATNTPTFLINTRMRFIDN